jgi:phosphoglucomutase
VKDIIKLWLNHKNLDLSLKEELLSLSKEELEEAFYTNISFGTGGLRGIIGVGTNRMNIYTIRKATLGFARYILNTYPDAKTRGIVIAFDSRHKSVEFSKETAKVMASLGIKVYLFQELRPTPELSYAVRFLKCVGGVMITASHNPPNYNGYKVYDDDGCQLIPEKADQVISQIESIDDILDFDAGDLAKHYEKGLIVDIGNEIDNLYLEQVYQTQVNRNVNKNNLKIVFTPLHGTASVFGASMLQKLGYHVTPVKEQMTNDPNFPTVKSPNPEENGAFDYAIKVGKNEHADILLATDPDADRLGVAVRNGTGEYTLLNGNQIGAIILFYLAKYKPRNKQGVVFNTVVSSNLAKSIAKDYNLELVQTLTGFKYIGEQAKLLEGTNKEFFFGYEESHGYVLADFVRDKDAFQSLMILAEIAAFYKDRNQSLLDVLETIYQKYGYFVETQINMTLSGIEGSKKIQKIIDYFKQSKLDNIAGMKIITIEDFEDQVKIENGIRTSINLPSSQVLKYTFENGGWFVLRPSGTEPKIKFYVSITSDTYEKSNELVSSLKKEILKIVDKI